MTGLVDHPLATLRAPARSDTVREPEARDQRSSSRRGIAVAAGALAVLIATSLFLRLQGLGSGLWIDEGISIGIASHRLTEIPGLLRQDGSPPLYYAVLHGWMRLFGSSETATHALSLVISTVTVPASLWAGWSLFGRRVGWFLAGLMAFSPYLSYFATETRMYSLVVLLALVATASFLHAFVFARRRYLWVFVVSLTLVLYTHTWGLWLAAAAAAALIPCAAASEDRRRFWRDGAMSFLAVGVAYLPWVPTLAFQAGHTGAPWSQRPEPREVVSLVASVLGDPHERVLVALLLVAGPCLWFMVRRSPERPAVLATAMLASVPVVLGWLGAQVSPSWAPRYLAVCAPAVLLLAALGLSRERTRGFLALALILLLWIQPFARLSGRRPDAEAKAMVRPLAVAVTPSLKPGDLVIAMQMEEVPVLAYYLPAGLRFSTATGPVADPRVADWRDALASTRAATVDTVLAPQLDRAPVGSDVLLVCAQPGTGPTSLPWFALMERHCAEWRSALVFDPRFDPVTIPAPGGFSPTEEGRPVRQVLQFTKTSQ